MNTINRFDVFIDKVSSIILDIISNETDGFDDLNHDWGIKSKVFMFRQWSEEEEWIIEQDKMYDEFLVSLTPKEYQDYFAEQEEARSAFWKLEMAS